VSRKVMADVKRNGVDLFMDNKGHVTDKEVKPKRGTMAVQWGFDWEVALWEPFVDSTCTAGDVSSAPLKWIRWLPSKHTSIMSTTFQNADTQLKPANIGDSNSQEIVILETVDIPKMHPEVITLDTTDILDPRSTDSDEGWMCIICLDTLPTEDQWWHHLNHRECKHTYTPPRDDLTYRTWEMNGHNPRARGGIEVAAQPLLR
jgi:hypothetical protein